MMTNERLTEILLFYSTCIGPLTRILLPNKPILSPALTLPGCILHLQAHTLQDHTHRRQEHILQDPTHLLQEPILLQATDLHKPLEPILLFQAAILLELILLPQEAILQVPTLRFHQDHTDQLQVPIKLPLLRCNTCNLSNILLKPFTLNTPQAFTLQPECPVKATSHATYVEAEASTQKENNARPVTVQNAADAELSQDQASLASA